MKTTKEISKILGLILIMTNSVCGYGQSIENSYVVNQQVAIGGSSLFYVQISGVPSGATITNVEAKFEYIAYGVVQNYVSSRFNKDSDPGTNGGVVLVSQGTLPPGNPGTYGYNSFSTWNGQTSINTNYYFRFSLASGSPYTCTINKIYVRVSYSITLPPPALVSPTNGGTLSGPPYQFTWQGVSGAGAYQLKIADNVSFTNPIVNDQNISGSATSFQTSASLSYGQTYYWQMRTLNSSGTTWGSWSQYQSFTPSQGVLPPPALVSPTNGGTLSGPPYQFTWQGVSGAGAYQLKIADNVSFTNPIINDQNISGSATSFQTSASLSYGQTYYWQMRTLNSSGTTWGSWSQYQSFTPSQGVLPPPALVSPTNGGTLSGPPYQFTWQGVSGAGAYQLKIADNVSFTNPIINDQNISGSATSFQTSASLSYGQTYYWQMRTLNSSGTTWGSWGQYQIFIVSNSTSNQPIDDYPVSYKNSTKCCENACVDDAWLFYRRECTSFVCWRINRDLGYTQLQSTDPFRNYNVFGQVTHLGHAKFWADVLQGLDLNIQVDNTPKVGDIAHWSNEDYGHVAYVQSVNNDNTVNIEEYNFSSNCATMGFYSYRENITAERYIHIRDGNGGISSIRDQSLSSKFIIYPNPANLFVTIAYTNTEYLQKYKIKIFNSIGDLIATMPIKTTVSNINIENFSSGIYLFLIEIDGKAETFKIIKE